MCENGTRYIFLLVLLLALSVTQGVEASAGVNCWDYETGIDITTKGIIDPTDVIKCNGYDTNPDIQSLSVQLYHNGVAIGPPSVFTDCRAPLSFQTGEREIGCEGPIAFQPSSSDTSDDGHGQWVVIYTFYAERFEPLQTVVTTSSVSFMIVPLMPIPESPIGIIAMILGSFVALGVWMRLRH